MTIIHLGPIHYVLYIPHYNQYFAYGIFFYKLYKYIHTFYMILLYYDGGNGAKHRRISPNDATSYFTMSGRSFPMYISKSRQSGVHLMK
jgi:hypothetical protein